MKQVLLILAITSLLLAGGCNLFPGDPELPPITMDGRNTFGCLVDGKLFLPKPPSGFGSGTYVSIEKIADTVGISVYATNSVLHQNLNFFIYDVPTIVVGKVYDLASDPIFSIRYTDHSTGSSCTYQSIVSGNVEFLKFGISNPQSIIVSGIFNFIIYSDDCTRTINLTDGRFDISDIL